MAARTGISKREIDLDTPLSASASNAGAIFADNMFEVPRFQREYSWLSDEVTEFWDDLKGSLELRSYFLGLIILTKPPKEEEGRKQVVDGQQRIITLSLLANAIFHEALSRGRKALADRIQASFLRSIDFDSDAQIPRVKLSDASDNSTFQAILDTGQPPQGPVDTESVSARMIASHNLIVKMLRDDLKPDPFKRLGKWTEFLTKKLYFAVFVHPDASSAYQVYEVINTRGRDLTTADLLKNFVLSQAGHEQAHRYEQWLSISRQFATEGTNNLVQYIRHVVTARSGYVLPKDLYGFLAERSSSSGRVPPKPPELMELLQKHLPLYGQMIDPTSVGPADAEALGVFAALKDLSVLTVRPILLACSEVPDAKAGMEYILRLVVRRIVVGNLGTGNVERLFGEAAKSIRDQRDWTAMIDILRGLNPSKEDFIGQLRKRSFNKQVLGFVRRSIVQKSITPNSHGNLHFIWVKGSGFNGMTDEEAGNWPSTIGNTWLSDLEKRPKAVENWSTFKDVMLTAGVDGEWTTELGRVDQWNVASIEKIGTELAQAAGRIWYDV